MQAGAVSQEAPASPGTEHRAAPDLSFLYPLQRVKLRWHTLDGGEVAIPGQVEDVGTELVEVWFDREAASTSPMRADSLIWLDAGQGDVVHVVAGRVVERRPPDTLVVAPTGYARRDQRRHYVREIVELPSMQARLLFEEGYELGEPFLIWPMDLSGGGIRFRVTEPLPACEVRVRIMVSLGGDPFAVVAQPVGTYQTPGGEHVVRAFFTQIEERRRREIIQYVFRRQQQRPNVSAR